MQVAQVAAKMLGIPIDLVRILPTNSMTNPNGHKTGGSVTSESNCQVKYSVYSFVISKCKYTSACAYILLRKDL